MKTIYSDRYTTIETHKNFDLVVRHYTDTDDIKVKLVSGEGSRLAADMTKADSDGEAMPGHYISRHVLEFGYKQYDVHSAASSLGSVRTAKKSAAARRNGALGGRPRKEV